MNIPKPVIERLSRVYNFLCDMELSGNRGEKISSSELSKKTGIPAHTVRKDLSTVAVAANSTAGHNPTALKNNLETFLGFGVPKKLCVVGIGRLGQAIINYPGFSWNNFVLCAGFDNNVNKLELVSSPVPLHPSYMIEETVRKGGIEIAVLAVSKSGAQVSADRLCAGGIRGILNMTTENIRCPDSVFVRSFSIINELRTMTAFMSM